MNISWVNLDRQSLKFIYAKNTLNEGSREACNARSIWPWRFTRYSEVVVVVAPSSACPRREHRGQIICSPEQANNLAPLQTDILIKKKKKRPTYNRAGEGSGGRVPKFRIIFVQFISRVETWVYKHQVFGLSNGVLAPRAAAQLIRPFVGSVWALHVFLNMPRLFAAIPQYPSCYTRCVQPSGKYIYHFQTHVVTTQQFPNIVYIYVFRVTVVINRDYFPKNISLSVFVMEVWCLLWGRNWISLYNFLELDASKFEHFFSAIYPLTQWFLQAPPGVALTNTAFCPHYSTFLTHWGRVTQICVFTLQLCKTHEENLRF